MAFPSESSNIRNRTFSSNRRGTSPNLFRYSQLATTGKAVSPESYPALGLPTELYLEQMAAQGAIGACSKTIIQHEALGDNPYSESEQMAAQGEQKSDTHTESSHSDSSQRDNNDSNSDDDELQFHLSLNGSFNSLNSD